MAPVLDTLTDRQERVLELTANGWTIKEIAHQLGIAERTAKKHREQAVGRLNAANIVHAVVIYVSARKAQRTRRAAVRGQIGLDL